MDNICVLLIVFAVTPLAFGACPFGTTDQSGYCFGASKGTMKFWEAASICESMSCSMAYSNETAYLSALTSFASSKSMTDFWVGLMDAIEEGSWIDTSTQEQPSDINWDSGKPETNRNHNCAYASDSSLTLIDASCGNTKKFICDCGTS